VGVPQHPTLTTRTATAIDTGSTVYVAAETPFAVRTRDWRAILTWAGIAGQRLPVDDMEVEPGMHLFMIEKEGPQNGRNQPRVSDRPELSLLQLHELLAGLRDTLPTGAGSSGATD
jgi:hypothetical protein